MAKTSRFHTAEDEIFRLLEDEILEAAAAADECNAATSSSIPGITSTSPPAAADACAATPSQQRQQQQQSSPVDVTAAITIKNGPSALSKFQLRFGLRRERRWHPRVMAVAAFMAEGERRRRFEDGILASVMSADDISSVTLSRPGVKSGPQQPLQQQQRNGLGCKARGSGAGDGGGRGVKSGSAPGGMLGGLFSKEDEDAMDLILGGWGGGAAHKKTNGVSK
ncbi:hypothetical protein Agub_g10139 [Astrephomene gubernaculifera]|uniref:Uncharacterized protein n=1 Tax=Astrephomene gubernaculifera TaxID=47775 RepID=A0AAD3HPG0_9CHLO|nr:hypothetical protein Agub_g10139 [Astrephomene gubernaculifera]